MIGPLFKNTIALPYLPTITGPQIEMRMTDSMRKKLGKHHKNYQVGLGAVIVVAGVCWIVFTGNLKPKSGEDVVRICAEQFFIELIGLLRRLGISVTVKHIFLCAPPRPEKDQNSHFGARTPCSSCLNAIAATPELARVPWTLFTPFGDRAVPEVELTMPTERLLRECLPNCTHH